MYDATFKIIVFGDADVGKIELLKCADSQIFYSDTSNSVDIDFHEKESSSYNDKKEGIVSKLKKMLYKFLNLFTTKSFKIKKKYEHLEHQIKENNTKSQRFEIQGLNYEYEVRNLQLNGIGEFRVKNLEINGEKIKLQIWHHYDLERFRFLLPSYVKGANGGIFVYDISEYSSFTHIDDWLRLIRKKIDDLFPIILVGVITDPSKPREVSSEYAIKIAESKGLDAFIECDVKTGENAEKVFETLTRLMLQRSDFY